MIICITGFPGSGKSDAAKILAANGYKRYELSSVVWDLMSKAAMERTPENVKNFATMIRNKYGREVVAKLLFKKIKSLHNSRIVVVGLRSKSELNYIRKRAKTITIALVAPPKIRFARILKRHRPGDPKTLSQFIKNRDNVELKWGINSVINSADYIIANTRTESDLRKEVNEVLELIASRKS